MTSSSNALFPQAQERFIVFLIALVQFINIVDFMMVMPLGPQFAEGLGIGLSHLGIVAASYTASASISGIFCSLFIDRFDRKTALIFAMMGLAVGTLGGALSWNLTSLLFSRVIAGAFGGPATSVSLAIIADIIPAERRGKAISTVMMAFSIASIAGVPAGLELAMRGTWHTPFYALGALATSVALTIYLKLPNMRFHLKSENKNTAAWKLLTRPVVLNAYALVAFVMISGFMLFPNIAAFVQKNLNYPAESMSILYFSGGLASLLSMRFVGILVDRLGSTIVFGVGTIGFILGAVLAFYFNPPLIQPFMIFIIIMSFGTFRNISSQTITSKVPKLEERAGYMSIQSSVQHMAAAVGSGLSTLLLARSTDSVLVGMENVATASAVFSILACIAIYFLSLKVKEVAHSHR